VRGAFDDAPEDRKLEIAPGLEIVKWSIQRLELDLSCAELMDTLIPAKTAYEFLACHIASAIYDGAPQLCEVRNCITSGLLNNDVILVERLSSNKYEPFHGICFEGNDPYAKVQIRLFGWLAFRVHFRRLSIQGPRFIYTHSLDTKVEDVRLIGEAKTAYQRHQHVLWKAALLRRPAFHSRLWHTFEPIILRAFKNLVSLIL
jgi:hypothetical protein